MMNSEKTKSNDCVQLTDPQAKAESDWKDQDYPLPNSNIEENTNQPIQEDDRTNRLNRQREFFRERSEQFRTLVQKNKTGLSISHKSKLKKMKISQTSQCCSICQHSFLKDEIILQLPCKHIFHRKGCIGQWLKYSVYCPMCKFDLKDYYSRKEEPKIEKEFSFDIKIHEHMLADNQGALIHPD